MVRQAQTDCFHQVCPADVLGSIQVCYGARHFQYPEKCPCRKSSFPHGLLKVVLVLLPQLAVLLNFFLHKPGIDLAGPVHLPVSCLCDLLPE